VKSNYLKIGTLVYTVSKGWDKTKKEGAKVVPCRIIGYQNISGKIHPVLERRGYRHVEVAPETSYIFTDLDEAVDAIKVKK